MFVCFSVRFCLMVPANEWIEHFIWKAGVRRFLHFSLGFTKSRTCSHTPSRTITSSFPSAVINSLVVEGYILMGAGDEKRLCWLELGDAEGSRKLLTLNACAQEIIIIMICFCWLPCFHHCSNGSICWFTSWHHSEMMSLVWPSHVMDEHSWARREVPDPRG